jgi:hypothetical protein
MQRGQRVGEEDPGHAFIPNKSRAAAMEDFKIKRNFCQSHKHGRHGAASVPISFADACLVRMSELHQDCAVWTLDSDFREKSSHGGHGVHGGGEEKSAKPLGSVADQPFNYDIHFGGRSGSGAGMRQMPGVRLGRIQRGQRVGEEDPGHA